MRVTNPQLTEEETADDDRKDEVFKSDCFGLRTRFLPVTNCSYRTMKRSIESPHNLFLEHSRPNQVFALSYTITGSDCQRIVHQKKIRIETTPTVLKSDKYLSDPVRNQSKFRCPNLIS